MRGGLLARRPTEINASTAPPIAPAVYSLAARNSDLRVRSFRESDFDNRILFRLFHLGGQFEVNGDINLALDWFTVELERAVTPLPDGVHCRLN